MKAPRGTARASVRAILVGPCFSSARVAGRLLREECSSRDEFQSREAHSSRRGGNSSRDELLDAGARDLWIAIDGGLDVLRRARIRADFAVGDWDSSRARHAPRDVRHVSLPRGKDRSDLFFAVAAALEAGATEIICLGVTGGRMDHHLATMLDLAYWSERLPKGASAIQALDEGTSYHFVSCRTGALKLSAKKGSRVSVFALGGRAAKGVTLKGFKYPLNRARLEPSSHGLSNVASSSVCEIRVESGALAVVVPAAERRW